MASVMSYGVFCMFGTEAWANLLYTCQGTRSCVIPKDAGLVLFSAELGRLADKRQVEHRACSGLFSVTTSWRNRSTRIVGAAVVCKAI